MTSPPPLPGSHRQPPPVSKRIRFLTIIAWLFVIAGLGVLGWMGMKALLITLYGWGLAGGGGAGGN